MDSIVRVLGNTALAAEANAEVEASLITKAQGALVYANRLVVVDDQGFRDADAFKKQIKEVQKAVKEYWEPFRVEAKKIYDQVLADKKTMTDPLDAAEKVISKKLNEYAYEQEKKRRAEEAERQRQREAEINRLLEEAARAETSGDAMSAEVAMTEAEVYDSANVTVTETPKEISGAKQQIAWEIDAIECELVPITICGVEVHSKNKAVVTQLVQQAIDRSNGSVKIPGVTYHQTMKVR